MIEKSGTCVQRVAHLDVLEIRSCVRETDIDDISLDTNHVRTMFIDTCHDEVGRIWEYTVHVKLPSHEYIFEFLY